MAGGTAWLLVEEGNVRLAIAVALMTLLGGLTLISPQGAVVGTLIFLTALGDIRRALIPLAGWSDQDPLLLVGPGIAILLVTFATVGKQFRLDTPLSRWILALMILMLLHAANPTQPGGPTAGIAGALFYVVPLLWFWIGRSYANQKFMTFLLYGVVVPMAVLGSLLGLYQAFYGLLPFEQAWVNLAGYSALGVEGQVRPISFCTSSAEYGHYVAVAIAVLWAGWLRKAHISMVVVPMVVVPLLAIALFLASMRGVVVMLLLTMALLWAVQARGGAARSLRLLLGLAVGVAVVYPTLLQLQHINFDEQIDGLVDHQVEGLLDPFNDETSTAVVHYKMFNSGFSAAVSNPLGHGLGATTIAADKFGDGSGLLGATAVGNTEVDLSNIFVSLGVIGGAVYAVIIVSVLLTAFRYWRVSGSFVALAILGILVVELGQWLTGGHYAMSALIWFCVGALDNLQGSDKGA
jgi:hypothetical protein